jgi:hypothetical protein
VVARFAVKLDGEPIGLVATPPPLPADSLRPEFGARRGWRIVGVAAAAAGAAMLTQAITRGSAPLDDFATDRSRAPMFAGVVLAAGVGAYLTDRGDRLTENVAHNDRVRAARRGHAAQQARVQSYNDARIKAWRSVLRVERELR